MALETNLVANYRLENIKDNKGSNDLTNNNSVTFTSALVQNGANLGTANTNKSLDTTSNLGVSGSNANFSICFWVKMLTEISSGTGGFISLRDSVGKFLFQIYYEYNGGTRRVTFNRQTFAVANNTFSSNIALGTSSFHQIVMTFDGTTNKGYIDGTSAGSLGASGNGTGSPTNLFAIGYTDTNYSSALFDETSVWSRAITSTEVTQLYNSGKGMYFDGSTFKDPSTLNPGGALFFAQL